MTPLVNVIIPAYNAARFLAKTLDSLRAQTCQTFETLVVDDGSKDQTAAIVRGYPEVRLLVQTNAGVAAARNRGVRETQSDWVAFLDADDFWMPEKLRLQVEAAAQGNADAVFCGLKVVDVAGSEVPLAQSAIVSLEMGPLLLHNDSIPQGTSSTILVRRTVFESIGGYDESLATMADWDLLIRLRQRTTFAYVAEPLVAYRRYPGTMSRQVDMLERESLAILEKVFGRTDLPGDWRRLEGRSRAWNDLVLSGSHFESGNIGSAVRFGFRALRRDPQLLGRFVATPLRRAKRWTSRSS